MPDDTQAPTQTYMAKSVFTDLTSISLFIIAALQVPAVEGFFDWVSAIINRMIADPELAKVNLVKAFEGLSALIGLWHRFFRANNPVAGIAPGHVKPVEVKSLTPTMPADPPKPPKE